MITQTTVNEFILAVGATPDGTKVQIENWNNDYSFMSYGATIGAYPIAKRSQKGQFSPKEGRSFRFSFTLESHEQAKQVFNDLTNGATTLKDYIQFSDNPRNEIFI